MKRREWKIREVTEKFTLEVDIERRNYEDLLDEKNNMELAYEDRITQLQNQQAEASSAEWCSIELCGCYQKALTLRMLTGLCLK